MQKTASEFEFLLQVNQQEIIKYYPDARFYVFMAVMIQVKIFWAVVLCSVTIRYQHYGGPCYFHLQGGVHGAGMWT
jgi:hypothetical protein